MYKESIISDLELRWSKITAELTSSGCDALLVSSPANLYYVSGRVFSGYALFLSESKEPLFFVKRPIGLKGNNVIYIRKPEDIIEYISEKNITVPKKIMMELDTAAYSEIERYKNIFEGSEISNGSSVMRIARSVKTPLELSLLRESGVKHAESYAEIKSLYRPEMNDMDLQIEVEKVLRKNGSLGLFRIAGTSMEIFMGSLIAGENADNPSPYDFAMGGAGQNSSLPVGSNGTPLKKGVTIMVDMGGNFTGYMTDMTRLYSVGEPDELVRKAHETSLEIMRMFEHEARPGKKANELYDKAAEIAKDAGLTGYFMGYSQKAGFVGHGIGIEINEQPVLAPKSRDILKEGMVIAVEPKFVIPGTGAVGIENTYIVTNNGVEKITNAPEEIVVL